MSAVALDLSSPLLSGNGFLKGAAEFHLQRDPCRGLDWHVAIDKSLPGRSFDDVALCTTCTDRGGALGKWHARLSWHNSE